MNEYSEVLFENFSLYFPSEVENVKSYEQDSTMPFELRLEFKDGSIHIFNELDNTICTIQRDPCGMTEKEWRKEFGRRLHNLITLKGWNQGMFAEIVGISPTNLSAYINGRNMPGFYVVDKMARALECSLDDLRYI